MDQTFMKEKPVLPLVLSMSLPMVLSMLVNALYNIIDSYFVAKISEDAMTALSLVFPLQNLTSAAGVGFGIGINAVIAYFMGAQDRQSASNAATQGMILSIIHGILLTIACIAVMPAFLGLFTSDAVVMDYGLRYSNIVFGFTTILIVSVAFEKIFQSVGKMVVSMIALTSGCLTNIILDPVMIFGWGPVPAMGIEGAAIATGIGQTVNLLIYLVIFLARPLPVRFEFKKQMKEKKLFGRLYGVGVPAALNIALPSLLISVLNGILAAYSDMYVLILGIYYKLQTFLYLTANGIIQGIRPLVGYNYGAREYKRVRKIYTTALLVAVIVMTVGMILCLAVPSELIHLYTENSETIAAGAVALRIISFGFIVSAVTVTSSGALEGLGRGGPSLVISLLRYIIIIIPAAYILSRFMGATGVWHAFWFSETVTAAVAYFIYHRTMKRAQPVKGGIDDDRSKTL